MNGHFGECGFVLVLNLDGACEIITLDIVRIGGKNTHGLKEQLAKSIEQSFYNEG